MSPFDSACYFDRPVDVGLRINKAAQLHTPLNVSTLISLDFSEASLKISAFTLV